MRSRPSESDSSPAVTDYQTPQENRAASANSPSRSTSTQEAIAVSSPQTNRKRAGSPEIGGSKRRSLDPRAVNGLRDHVSESPQPPAIPERVELEETPSPNPEGPAGDKGMVEDPFGSPARSEPRTVGQGLLEFAASLGSLSRLLNMAAEELDDEAIEGLEDEINHDWRVQEMATFVEGYFKGASKRRKRR
jgi:hypothetical protein